MIHYDENIIQLIELYLVDDLSGEEKRQLETWLQQDPSHKELFEHICMNGNVARDFESFEKIDKNMAWKHVAAKGGIKVVGKSRGLNWYRWVAAVMLPLMIVAVGYYVMNDSGKSQQTKYEIAGIQPGKSKAILRLDNNRVIELAGENEMRLEVAKGIAVKNNASGVVYPEQVANNGETVYNVLEVPRGGEYTITLSDGTMVYLNSGSELRYPVAFNSDIREVFLSGEGFFEVTKDAERPFFVVTDDLKIKVYGTSFNVNTYNIANVQTVLVEGKIGIQEKNSDVEFEVEPGQLALYDREKGEMEIRDVDVLPYVAWKNQEFVFDGKSLEDIMNTLSLWYDVDVFFQTASLKQLHFTGHLGRYEDISHILDAISGVTQVNFSVKGRTIIVME